MLRQAELHGVKERSGVWSSRNKEEVGRGGSQGSWGLCREGAEGGEKEEQGYIADGGENKCLVRGFKLF